MGPRPQRKSVEPPAYLITPMGVPARFSRRWRSGPVDPRAGPGEGGDGLAFAGLTGPPDRPGAVAWRIAMRRPMRAEPVATPSQTCKAGRTSRPALDEKGRHYGS
jgi:hypothetical protein